MSKENKNTLDFNCLFAPKMIYINFSRLNETIISTDIFVLSSFSSTNLDRASQIHGVPRKTLRNWMKRWHIKSVYPMPYQLKKAAEMKRQTVRNRNEAQTSNPVARIDLSESETNEY